MDFDVDRARRETPGCEHVTHFNNAGASLMPSAVVDATVGHLQLEARIGGYEAAAAAQQDVNGTYDAVAALIGCHREEVAIVENATRAWDMAFYAMRFKRGDRILTAQAEYASNYIAYLQVAERQGVAVEVVPNDETGQLSVDALRRMIDARVKLIAVSHVPTNGGLINPASEIGAVARDAGVPYLLDACQSIGQLDVNVDAIGCDMLSATGRKYLRGPRGTGFLYVRRGLLDDLDPPLLDAHAATWVSRDRYVVRPDARRFENWEYYVAGKIGLGAAVSYAMEWGIPMIQSRVVALAANLRETLSQIPGVTVCDLGRSQCGIVTFTVEGKDAAMVQQQLRREKINVSVSPREWTLLDMQARGLDSLVRASVHYYNTAEELAQLVSVVARP